MHPLGGAERGGERFTLIFPDPLFFPFNGRRVPVESRSATLRRPTYSKQASRSGTDPRSVVNLGRRLISMLRISNRLEHAGGDERRALWKQQPADVQVSVRTANPMGCGACPFIRLSRVLRRSWVVKCNMFRSSENMHEHVNELLVRLIHHSTPSHSNATAWANMP
jgi:hypothetical protein